MKIIFFLIGVLFLSLGAILFVSGSARMEYVLEHKREFFPWDENFTGTLGWCGTSWSDAYGEANVTMGIGIVGIGAGIVGIGISLMLTAEQRRRTQS